MRLRLGGAIPKRNSYINEQLYVYGHRGRLMNPQESYILLSSPLHEYRLAADWRQ
ncbi:hypothetical protein LBMAG40_07500 [Cyanobium sp.]|nr:hypothetical protein LBMAG40_07500 [Cyanobium sp.]